MRYNKIMSLCLSSVLAIGSVFSSVPVMADTVQTEEAADDVVEKCETHTYDENSITWYIQPNMGLVGGEDTYYDVSISSYENGTVTVTDAYGEECEKFIPDDKVIVKAIPDEGYSIGLIAVLYDDGATVEDITEDKFFYMPYSAATVITVFVTEGETVPDINDIINTPDTGSTEEEESETEDPEEDEYIGYAVRTCKVCGASEKVKAEKLSEEAYNTEASEGVCGGTGVKFHFKATFEDDSVEETDFIYTIGASHEFDDGVITLSPSCSTPGILTRTCENCSETEVEMIDIDPEAHNIVIKAGHVYEEEVTKEPTCTEKGVKTFSCKNCDHFYTEEIQMSDHEYDDGVVTTKPMYGKEGVMTYTCKNCTDSYTESISAITECTHAEESFDVETIDPTCSVDGKKIYTCKECGYSYELKISATGKHEYDEGVITKEPTCTEKGIKTFTCKHCDDFYTEEVQMADHEYDEGVITKKPSFKEDGVKTYTCQNCGHTKTEVLSKITDCEHDYETEVTEATCGKDGEIRYTCKKCEYSYTDTISATGDHEYVSKITKEATCTEKGVRTYTCKNCKTFYTEEIPVIDHEYSDWVITKESTCTVNGIKTCACKYCGNPKTEELQLKAHEHKIVKEKAPTCISNGYTGDEICSNCGKVFSKGMTITPVGHKYETKITKKATCTENGLKETRCTVCNDLSNSEIIPKLGHKYTSKITKNATCTENGVKTYTCTGCNHTYTESIPKTGHSFSGWKKVSNATVFKAAVNERTCSKCRAKETKTVGSKLTPTIKVNAASITLKKKQNTSGLKITGLAAGDYVKTYVTSNSKLFKVTGTKNGTCKITAQNKTGKGYLTVKLASGLTKKITITVQKANVGTSSIGNLPKNITITKNKTYTLKPVISPFTCTYKASYSSTNKKIATVSSSGKITGKKKGSCYIKVKAGSKTVKIKVTVK